MDSYWDKAVLSNICTLWRATRYSKEMEDVEGDEERQLERNLSRTRKDERGTKDQSRW